MRRLLATLLLILPLTVLAQPGTLDASFGDGGTLRLTPAPIAGANEVVVAPDGKLLLAGRVGNDAAVVRLNPDGSLDADFGDGGYALVDLGGDDPDTPEAFAGIALRPDGTIVVAGPAGGLSVVAQLTPDGALDAGFADGGLALLNVDGGFQISGLELLPTGAVLVVGSALFENQEQAEAVVARISADGLLDADFGADGYGRVAIAAGGAAALGLDVQADGQIVIGGFVDMKDFFSVSAFAARLTADGALDEGFGDGGVRVLDFGSGTSFALDVIADASGRIVLAGAALDFIAQSSALVLARLDADGALDGTFGSDGLVVTTLGAGLAQGLAVAQQPDGKLIAAGAVGSDASAADFAVARFLPDGTLDSAFGDDGVARADFASIDVAASVLLQPDGRIVAAGFENTFDGEPVAIQVARFENDATTDTGEAGPTARPLALAMPYPNPTAGGAQARYTLPAPAHVRLAVYDVLGREVAVLADGARSAGDHVVTFDGRQLPAGVYVMHLLTGGRASTQRVTLLR